MSTDSQNPAPGSDAYNQQMAARFDRGTGPVTEQETPLIPPMPEGGVEKFYDKKTGAYNWQAHARELEFKLSQKGGNNNKKPDSSTTEQKNDKSGEQASDDQVKNIVEAAGLKVEDLKNQILQDGTISAAAKQALVKSGIPEVLIDEYVSLANSALARNQTDALSYMGGGDPAKGEAVWKSLNDWATKNLTDSEKQRYNEMLSGPDWKVAVDTLLSKVKSASPLAGESQLITGTTSGGAVTGYASKMEMIRDMQSEKYRTDPAFRTQVRMKVAVSQFHADGID